MIHGILQFTLPIAFRCVLHRWENQEIRCRKFERTLRSMAIRRACLFECHEISHPKRFLNETAWRMGSGWVPLPALPSTGSPEMHERLETLCIRLSVWEEAAKQCFSPGMA